MMKDVRKGLGRWLAIAALSASFTLVNGVSAWADAVLFDPTGTGAGTISNVNSLDVLPGNAIAKGGTNAMTGDTVPVLYQAKVGSVLSGTTTVDLTSSPAYTITAVTSFTEQVTSTSRTMTLGSATFALDTSKTYYVSLYQTPVGNSVNELTGTGYPGTRLILKAEVLAPNFLGSFTADFTDIELLDQFMGDSRAGQLSVQGTGSTKFNAKAFVDGTDGTFVDTNFFRNPGLKEIDLNKFNTSEIDSFGSVDPTVLFHPSLNPLDDYPSTPANLGNVNGLPATLGGTGRDFQFQADANGGILSVVAVAVPEPSTLVLSLLAGASCGLGLIRRRRQKVVVG
jgi:hypothetical protein